MKISELANECGYEFCGEDREVNSILYSYCAEEDSIAIVNSISEVNQTKARSILTKPVFMKTDKTLLYINEPIEIASVKIANILIERREIKVDDGPIYIKHNECYQGENVKIGDGTVISPKVYIGNDVNIIFYNCSISYIYIRLNITIFSNANIISNIYFR